MAPFAILSITLLLAGGGLLMGWKHVDQEYRDHNRKTYRLTFPSDLTAEHVVAMLRAFSGSLHPKRHHLLGSPTIAFEMWSTDKGIVHRVKIPWQDDYLIEQLLAHVPGVRYEPEKEFPTAEWKSIVEVGLTHSARTLYIPEPQALSHSILKTMEGLEVPETLLVQMVITGAPRLAKPIHREAQSDHINLRSLSGKNEASKDEVNDRRAKLDDPNFLAVLRVGAAAETIVRADHLVDNVRKSIVQSQTASTRFRKRHATKKQLQSRLDNAAGLIDWPMLLSASELAALIAWPLDNPAVAGLPQSRARHLATPESVPRIGRVVGHSTLPGRERRIAIGYEEALWHTHVMGPTGVGKTVLLANMMKQDMEQGYGVILIENKGDLFHSALDYVPANRLRDVIVMDLNETAFPVGFNLLDQGEAHLVVDGLILLFKSLFKNNPSLWVNEVLYYGLHTLATIKGSTFTDLRPLINPTSSDREWREAVIRSIKDPDLKAWWQEFENQGKQRQDQKVEPLLTRLWELNRPIMRNVLGQSVSSFQMTDVIRDNKILLVNLGKLPQETANLMATLVFNSVWSEVQKTYTPGANFLYLDEVQSLSDMPVEPEDMLAKARSMKLGITLAHQHLGQLSNELRQGVQTNARNKVVFQTSADDARAMTREFGKAVSDNDFMNLARYEAIARVATPTGMSPPVTLITERPAESLHTGKRVLELSRRDYGRPIETVLADIAQRHTAEKHSRGPRPTIGGEDIRQ